MVEPPVINCTIPCPAGFTHTAFVFGYESQVHKSEIVGDSVPAGALITTFQKGLQYLELEANLAAEVRDHSQSWLLRAGRLTGSGPPLYTSSPVA